MHSTHNEHFQEPYLWLFGIVHACFKKKSGLFFIWFFFLLNRISFIENHCIEKSSHFYYFGTGCLYYALDAKCIFLLVNVWTSHTNWCILPKKVLLFWLFGELFEQTNFTSKTTNLLPLLLPINLLYPHFKVTSWDQCPAKMSKKIKPP